MQQTHYNLFVVSLFRVIDSNCGRWVACAGLVAKVPDSTLCPKAKMKVFYVSLVSFDHRLLNVPQNSIRLRLNPGWKVSSTNGIDDRITQGTGAKDSNGDK